jgi:hypothetical protein
MIAEGSDVGVSPVASQLPEKFATQVNAAILSAVRNLAYSEGRQIQTLVDEALADLICPSTAV